MKKDIIITAILLLFFTLTTKAQWVNKSNGLPKDWIYPNSISAIDSLNAIISIRTGLYKTSDGGNNWEEVSFDEKKYGEAYHISMIDKNNIWLGTYTGKIVKLTNNYQNVKLQFSDTTRTHFMNYIEMFDSKNGVAMGDAPTRSKPILILKTTNGGLDWEAIDNNVIGLVSGDGWRRIDFIDMNNGYFFSSRSSLLDQKLFKTTDGGNFWNTIAKPFPLIDVMKFYNKNIGLAAFHPYKYIYKTLDGGVGWDSIKFVFSGWVEDIEFIPGSSSKVWLTDYYNLYFSKDTGTSWTKVNVVDTTLRGMDIIFLDENVGWLLCGNGVVYRTTNGGGVITSENNEWDKIQNEFSLEQNYPNPFNPATTITFSVPSVGAEHVQPLHVLLKVYDLLGREIATLVNEEKAPGNYEVKFDMETFHGTSLLC